ncbi:hypothetical protein J3E74DRAFT_400657 [Bipolaris maydis]|nr:hypothetical protein J3E74DRAFT_400657 [Bipolaris maydis]
MNGLSLRPGYVCSNCIQNISRRNSGLPTRSQLRLQSTTAFPQDAPNPRLRLQKHWSGDVKSTYRDKPPTQSMLHMSKTKGSYRLELTEEQTSPATGGDPFPEEPRPLSMRERRQQRREGILRSSTIHVDPAYLPERRQVEKEGLSPEPSAPQDFEAEDLQPSTPSPPLGSKRRSEPILPSIKPELPSSHVKLHFSKLEDFHWYWESFPPTIAQKTQANHFFTNNSKNAKLLRSVAQFRLFPESDVPEVAFVGRSNVGKSSLLNAVVNADIKALLARTSSTPGFTKTMNLYGLGAGNGVTIKKQPNGRDKIVGIGGLTIVDMPGYGEGSLSSWGVEIMKYISNRKQLRHRSLLASLRLAGVSHQVILSKLDKLYIPNAKDIKRFDGKSARRLAPKGTPGDLRKAMEKLKNEIQPPVGGGALGEILGVSAETLVDGKRLGIDHVRFAILKAAGLDEKFKKDISTPWARDS